MLFCGCYDNTSPPVTDAPKDGLTVHYIDVGQADCALITVDGKNMLIDGGNVTDGMDVINFLEEKSITRLDVVVATHAHEDHIGGLSAIIDSFIVDKIYCPVDKYNSTCFSEFVDAANRQCGITLCGKGMGWQLGTADISVFWPVEPENQHANNTSIVLKLTYGETSFLFTGDVEKDAESQFNNEDISADVLKVAHHGSSTSTSYLFLRQANPRLAIISCGKDNSYGHPHSETLDILSQAEVKVMRTDHFGTITVKSDGTSITVNGQTLSPRGTPGLTQYIGNLKSKKLHLPTCPNLPKTENMVIFPTRQEAIDGGYTPCQNCNP